MRKIALAAAGCQFGCCVVFFLIIIISLWASTKDSEGCGAPVLLWLYVFFIAAFLVQLVNFCILCCGGSSFVAKQLCWMFFSYLFLLIWVIYGWTVYASEDDDCGEKESTRGWWIFFIIILSFITIIFIILILLLCVLGCIICCCINREDPSSNMNGEGIKNVLSTLTKVPFDSTKHEECCAICMEEFTKDDTLTVLKCNPKHYFHNHCIEDWVKKGKNTCPLCRVTIADVE